MTRCPRRRLSTGATKIASSPLAPRRRGPLVDDSISPSCHYLSSPLFAEILRPFSDNRPAIAVSIFRQPTQLRSPADPIRLWTHSTLEAPAALLPVARRTAADLGQPAVLCTHCQAASEGEYLPGRPAASSPPTSCRSNPGWPPDRQAAGMSTSRRIRARPTSPPPPPCSSPRGSLARPRGIAELPPSQGPAPVSTPQERRPNPPFPGSIQQLALQCRRRRLRKPRLLSPRPSSAADHSARSASH
jgi:hypothetical protein